MSRSVVQLAGRALSLDEQELAARLGVTVFAIRRWQKREPPPYIVLALAALIVNIDTEKVWSNLRSRRRPVQATEDMRNTSSGTILVNGGYTTK
jgi:hypothetical protein